MRAAPLLWVPCGIPVGLHLLILPAPLPCNQTPACALRLIPELGNTELRDRCPHVSVPEWLGAGLTLTPRGLLPQPPGT